MSYFREEKITILMYFKNNIKFYALVLRVVKPGIIDVSKYNNLQFRSLHEYQVKNRLK